MKILAKLCTTQVHRIQFTSKTMSTSFLILFFFLAQKTLNSLHYFFYTSMNCTYFTDWNSSQSKIPRNICFRKWRLNSSCEYSTVLYVCCSDTKWNRAACFTNRQQLHILINRVACVWVCKNDIRRNVSIKLKSEWACECHMPYFGRVPTHLFRIHVVAVDFVVFVHTRYTCSIVMIFMCNLLHTKFSFTIAIMSI